MRCNDRIGPFHVVRRFSRPPLCCWCLGPSKLRIWLDRHLLAEGCGTDFAACGRHVKKSHARLQKRWAECDVMIPGNWPVESCQVDSSFFAIDNGLNAIERNHTPQPHLGLRQIGFINERWRRSLRSRLSTPIHHGSFTVGTVACSNLFWRGRAKVVKADTVPCDACQQPAFRRRAINSGVFASCVRRRVYGSPGRLPQRIDGTMLARNQFANMSATFKDGDVTPCTLDAEPRAPVQNVRTTNQGRRYAWEPDVPLAILEPDEEGFIAGRTSIAQSPSPVANPADSDGWASALRRYAVFSDSETTSYSVRSRL